MEFVASGPGRLRRRVPNDLEPVCECRLGPLHQRAELGEGRGQLCELGIGRGGASVSRNVL